MDNLWELYADEAEEYAREILQGEEQSFDYENNFEKICESYIDQKISEREALNHD